MTISDAITVYWPVLTSIVIAVAFFVGIYINLNNKVLELRLEGVDRDKQIAELKGRVNAMQPDLSTIKTDIAVIKNTLEFIKGSVQKLPVINNN